MTLSEIVSKDYEGYRRIKNDFMVGLGAGADECPVYRRHDGLIVCFTEQIEKDSHLWLHASISKPKQKLPSYRDLSEIKLKFLGADSIAYQIFAPEAEHVNIHPACLHLWHPVTHRPTPDFTHGCGSI